MAAALDRLAEGDPVDQESGRTIIKGLSEHQLETNIERLKRELQVEVNVAGPQVAYRETITKTREHDYTYKKQIGAPTSRCTSIIMSRCRSSPDDPGTFPGAMALRP